MQVKLRLVEIAPSEEEDDPGHILSFYIEDLEDAQALAHHYFRTILVDLPSPRPADVLLAVTEDS